MIGPDFTKVPADNFEPLLQNTFQDTMGFVDNAELGINIKDGVQSGSFSVECLFHLWRGVRRCRRHLYGFRRANRGYEQLRRGDKRCRRHIYSSLTASIAACCR